MTIKNIEQATDETKKTARSNYSSGLKVKTHIKAGPNLNSDSGPSSGGVNNVRED